MICRRRKIIFVHAPKCGGMSIEDTLWPGSRKLRTTEDLWGGLVRPLHNKYQTGGLQHLTAQLIRREVGADLFDACFKFAFCRHPVDRIVSQYRFISRRANLREFIGLTEPYDFETYLDRIARRTHVQWMPQNEFFFDDHGTLLVDRLYRLEDLIDDVGPLNRDLGLELPALPHVNPSPDVPHPAIAAEAAERIFAMYRLDFERLGYPFDTGRHA